jgi:hypothetical protein
MFNQTAGIHTVFIEMTNRPRSESRLIRDRQDVRRGIDIQFHVSNMGAILFISA